MVTRQAREAIFITVGPEPRGAPPKVIHLGRGPVRFRVLLAYQAILLEQLRWPPTSIVVPGANRLNLARPFAIRCSPRRSMPV
jgi:hypothetical protein